MLAPYRRRIADINDLPHNDDVEILLVDKHTHAPTPKDELGEVEVGPLELIENAHRADALQHGHIEFSGKHYVDFIHLSRLFESIQGRLEQFWTRTLQALAEHKVTPELITVLYLDEEKGWEYLIPRFMAPRPVAECRPVRRQDLFAPRAGGEAPMKGQCVWFILPAIASGETARRCLEYAVRLQPPSPAPEGARGPSRIVISALVGRMPAAELTFYQGVRGYRWAQTQLEVLSFLPLPAYASKNECPICAQLQILAANLQRIERWTLAHSLALWARASLCPQQASAHVPSGTPEETQQAAIAAQMSALFDYGLRDVLMRKKLGDMLNERQGYSSFLEMVGAHCDLKRFAKVNVENALYTRYAPLRETARSLLQADDRVLPVTMLDAGVRSLY